MLFSQISGYIYIRKFNFKINWNHDTQIFKFLLRSYRLSYLPWFLNLLSCHNPVEQHWCLGSKSWKKALWHGGMRIINIVSPIHFEQAYRNHKLVTANQVYYMNLFLQPNIISVLNQLIIGILFLLDFWKSEIRRNTIRHGTFKLCLWKLYRYNQCC